MKDLELFSELKCHSPLSVAPSTLEIAVNRLATQRLNVENSKRQIKDLQQLLSQQPKAREQRRRIKENLMQKTTRLKQSEIDQAKAEKDFSRVHETLKESGSQWAKVAEQLVRTRIRQKRYWQAFNRIQGLMERERSQRQALTTRYAKAYYTNAPPKTVKEFISYANRVGHTLTGTMIHVNKPFRKLPRIHGLHIMGARGHANVHHVFMVAWENGVVGLPVGWLHIARPGFLMHGDPEESEASAYGLTIRVETDKQVECELQRKWVKTLRGLAVRRTKLLNPNLTRH